MVVEDLNAHRAQRNGKWVPPQIVEVDAFIGVEAPKRAYLDDSKMLPMRQVILLGGDGGTGKSLLALQLALACSSVLPYWLGMQVKVGPVIYFSAEDDIDEIHKRFEEICETEGADLELARGNLSIIAMAGQEMDAVLAVENTKTGTMEATPLYRWLDTLMQERSPMLLILDNLADVYGGNENNRTAVKQFINLLRRLAIKHDCVVLLLSHPSQMGRSSGSGESGSTGWNNGVRVRIYLHRLISDNGVEDDEDVRELEVMKSNYSRKGRKIKMRWDGGRFVVDTSSSDYFAGVPPQFYLQVQVAFSAREYRTSGQSPDWGGYKVAEMLDWDVGIGLTSSKQRTPEQNNNYEKIGRLLAEMVKSKAIRIVKRPDSHGDERPFFAAGVEGGKQ